MVLWCQSSEPIRISFCLVTTFDLSSVLCITVITSVREAGDGRLSGGQLACPQFVLTLFHLFILVPGDVSPLLTI